MPKCSNHCNKKGCIFFKKAEIPAVVANDDITPPQNGDFCNMLVVYQATGNAYLFASDGIPTLLSSNDYRKLNHLPSINGVTIIGDLTLSDIGVTQLVEEEAEARRDADNDLQEQIDTIAASSDVVDIVGTYQELMQYDTSHLTINDVIKVLDDETENDATTYYRWTNDGWLFIGQEGPYCTKSQVNELLAGKLDNDALDDYYDKAETDALLADKVDVSDLATKQDKLIAGANITIDQATNTISATVPSLDNYYTKQETYSQTEVDNLISGVEADIPTATSQLTNDSGFLTTLPIATSQILGGIKVGSGLSVTPDGTLSADAQHIDVDTALSTTSTNPVENRVITNALDNKANLSDIPTVPTNVSAFYNDAGYITSTTLAQNYYNKTETYTQTEVDTLISGVSANIPTKTSDLTNDGASGSSTYVEASELGNYVTLGTNQNITGEKTFVGNKRIKFKGTASNSKLGFTAYDQNNGENGFFEVEGASTASKKVRLGCYDQNSGGNARDNYVGFQYYNVKPVGGGTISYNLVCPPQYKGISGSNSFAYIPIDFTDGTTTVRAGVNGILDLSPLMPSYSDFSGATASAAGTHGFVPAPAAGDQEKFLKGDGTWGVVQPGTSVVQTTGQSTTDVMSQKAVTDELDTKADTSSLATVATTGDYSDLLNKPTIPAAQVNSDWNANSGVAQILNKPTLATVATSGLYSDLTGTPNIPIVNNATLTVTQNGATIGTFTANASSNATIALTDTTYSAFSGATSSAAGSAGLVPVPAAGDDTKFLAGDGTWQTVATGSIDKITNAEIDAIMGVA